MTDFGADFGEHLRGHRNDIILAALDADMFHHMKDHALTAFPDAVLSFVGQPGAGWMCWYMSLAAQAEGAIDGATDQIPGVGWLVDKATDAGGAMAGSVCFLRRFPCPITGNVPDLPFIKDDAGLTWDIQEDAATPRGKLDTWTDRVDSMIEKWGSLPDPLALQEQADRFTVAAATITSARDDSKFANDDYEQPLDGLVNQFRLGGRAFGAFHSRYAVSGPLVTHNLRQHMIDIGGYVVTDAALVQQVRESAASLVGSAPAAMAATHPEFGLGPIPGITDIANALADEETRTDAAVKLFFVVAGAVVGTVATAASGGSALALLAGVTGTGLTAVTALEGVVGATEGTVPDLAAGAEHPDDVWANLAGELLALDVAFAGEEAKLASLAQTTLDTLGGVLTQPAPVDVSFPMPFGPDVTVSVTPDLAISRSHDDAATLAAQDVIMNTAQPDQWSAEDPRGTDGEVNDARQQLIAIAQIVFVASRNTWVDIAGFARAGGLGDDPSHYVAGAAAELELRLRNHASLLDEGADALWEVWADFKRTDQLSAANIDRLYGRLGSPVVDRAGVAELDRSTAGQTP